jgi:hypothetical protein
MSGTSLRRLLDLFEVSRGALSIPDLADELGVTPERAESMVDFWVRKGKIRVSSVLSDCGSCGVKGNCPLVFDLPQIYELAESETAAPEQDQRLPCDL